MIQLLIISRVLLCPQLQPYKSARWALVSIEHGMSPVRRERQRRRSDTSTPHRRRHRMYHPAAPGSIHAELLTGAFEMKNVNPAHGLWGAPMIREFLLGASDPNSSLAQLRYSWQVHRSICIVTILTTFTAVCMCVAASICMYLHMPPPLANAVLCISASLSPRIWQARRLVVDAYCSQWGCYMFTRSRCAMDMIGTVIRGEVCCLLGAAPVVGCFACRLHCISLLPALAGLATLTL